LNKLIEKSSATGGFAPQAPKCSFHIASCWLRMLACSCMQSFV